MSEETLTVNLGDRSYPIHTGEGLIDRAPDLVPADLSGRKVFILHDSAVGDHARRLLSSLKKKTGEIKILSLPGGEKTKSYEVLQEILSWLLSNNVDRQSILFVMGGGVIGDIGGFAASIVLRGIDFVQIPTTLLAQVDSSVGGKTGINAPQGKNLVGSFYQPVAVLCDMGTLKTLPERELRAGYAEIVKYGLLGDRAFFEWLESNGRKVLALEPDALSHAVKTSCKMKADIVGTDERERAGGRRALLNLGHTFAHALEAAAGYDGRLLHGEAVSIGMVLAFRLCVKMGLCSGQDAVRVENHLSSCGLMTEIPPFIPRSPDHLTTLMQNDKKATKGRIGFILVNGIGEAFQSDAVDMADVREIIG